MGLRSRLGGWFVNGALKEYGLTSSDLKKAAPLLKQFVVANNGGVNDGNLRNRGVNQPAGGESGGFVDDDEGPSDIVLERYYDLMEKATSKTEIERLGEAIQDREQFLRRSIQNRENRNRGLDRRREPSDETPSSSTVKDLDMTNLGPHADEIAGEIVTWLSSTGLIPAAFKQQANGALSMAIKTHPDLIPKGLKVLDGVLARFGKPAKGGSEGAAQGGFDPTKPWEWAGQMGFSTTEQQQGK